MFHLELFHHRLIPPQPKIKKEKKRKKKGNEADQETEISNKDKWLMSRSV
jgi:hypothetical protein